MRGISTNELREMYWEYFQTKGHVRIPSAPLVPENDPSVLFTTAGMHPLAPYLQGQKHLAGKRLVNVQKCLRTTDIDEVGDTAHATVFEMLGNWSLGDYGREQAINMSWDFLTNKQYLGIEPACLAISVFSGEGVALRDNESAELWQSAGVPKERIVYLGKNDNWWPAGGKDAGPQGPDTEMFYWMGEGKAPAKFAVRDKRWVEIWNDVFMECDRAESGEYKPLRQKNVDTGMGVERVVMALGGYRTIYEIDTYKPLMGIIRNHERRPDPTEVNERIVADHIKASTFVMTDEYKITPSNTEQGYVLRRLIRRAAVKARLLGVEDFTELTQRGMEEVVRQYRETYPNMRKKLKEAQAEATSEIDKFRHTLQRGLKRLENYRGKQMAGADVSAMASTYGFPAEMTVEWARENKVKLSDKLEQEIREARESHRWVSRASAKRKFRGGLADQSNESIKYHTATHLLHQALRDVLGGEVLQKGSNITPERLRFDFTYPEKLSDEQKQEIEKAVNKAIVKDYKVNKEETTLSKAKKGGAIGIFESKYGERVIVYSIGDYSREICGGPHVERTGELGYFKIIKEESASAGVRRIKAVLS